MSIPILIVVVEVMLGLAAAFIGLLTCAGIHSIVKETAADNAIESFPLYLIAFILALGFLGLLLK